MPVRRRVVSALTVLAIGAGLAVVAAPPASAAVDTTVLEVSGDAGDFISGGHTFSYQPPVSTFTIVGTSSGVQVKADTASPSHSWTADFAPPTGGTLAVGTYSGALRSATADAPGLSVFGDLRACNQVTGSFTVLEIAVDGGTGDVTSFAATFEQNCDGQPGSSRGAVYYHSSLAYAAASTLVLSGPTSAAPGTGVALTGSLVDGAGPVPGATVSLSRTDSGGTTVLPDVTTGSDGAFAASAPLGLVDATFTASYAGDASHAASQATWQVSAVRPTTSLTVLAPTAVRRGVAYTLSGILSNGGRLANKLISVRRTDLAGTRTFSLRTNASGIYAYRDVPAVGGLVTWTVSWAGDSYRAPATASRRVTVTRLATALTAKASAASFAYGGKAVVTVHLGTTYNRRDVYVYARPLAPGAPVAPGTLIAHVRVNSLGNAVVSYLVRSRTTFTVRFAGDYRYNAAARALTVNVVARVPIQIAGTGYKSGSTYVVTGDAAYFRASTAPLRTSGCVSFQLQQYYGGRWITVDTVSCAAIQSDYYAYTYANRQLIGTLFRVRAYVAANSYSLGGTSAWITFKFA